MNLIQCVAHGSCPININSLPASLVAQMVKHLPAIRETQVRSVDQEDPLEEIATHSSTLA